MNTILLILRVIINDVSESSYDDLDLSRIICVAASLVKKDISLDVDYLINYNNYIITPDPTDENFINFVALKAAIILVRGELKDISSNSFKIVDGPSTIDTTTRNTSYKNYLDQLVDQYERDKISYAMNSSVGGYRAVITTPTTEDRI
jgi:hypothetical protein